MEFQGGCHCGNMSCRLSWPGEPSQIATRACGCSFCTAHGGVYTSHPDAALAVLIEDDGLVSRYRFGTETAEFYVCRRCGCVPFVTSEIEGRLYAVVNVNALRDVAEGLFVRQSSHFGEEGLAARLARRQQGWIGQVTFVDI